MRYRAPLDPECPQVQEFMSRLFDDPMTTAIGAQTGDLVDVFAIKHRRTCERCQEYGARNIEVVP